MKVAQNENQIGVVGTGLIGISWAGLFSAFGYETTVYDPHLKQENTALKVIYDIWKSLDIVFDDLSNKREVKFSDKIDGLKASTFIQENCPEDLALKKEIISELEQIVSDEAIIASSTSSFLPSELQMGCFQPDRVIAGSQKAADYLEIPHIIIHHGIDTETFKPNSDKTSLRNELGLPEGKLIGCFGRIRPQKGVDIFIDTMIKVCTEDRLAVGIICGQTTTEHRDFEEDLR
ncbi:3-hydroxyacyl-CoA dehydrogenase NAD-binding domain-containing protein, partial [Paracoccaceae bacterium]|nr:3-hydroxyacyl-CoA dehydrogenase NAD-binding domain-containing protein [Paracoccaceae bacterium]